MNTDKDIFSEALDPANADDWLPFLQAKSSQNRHNIYRVTIPEKSAQILRATAISDEDEDDAWGYVELAPNTSEYPIFRVPIRYVDQYCPAPTLPTKTLSEIYDVEANESRKSFTHMTLDSDGYWIGVASEDGAAYSIIPEKILRFSLTRTQP